MQDDSVDAVSDTDESMNVHSPTSYASPPNHGLFLLFLDFCYQSIYMFVCDHVYNSFIFFWVVSMG